MIAGRGAAAAGASAGRRKAQENMLIEEELQERIDDGLATDEDVSAESEADIDDPWYRRLTKSTEFSLLANMVILLNLAAMWLQADFPDWDFGSVNTLFLFFFVCELTLRLFTYGCYDFFTDPDDQGWNVFDFSIVTMGALDWSSRWFIPDRSSTTQFVTVIRILRIFRILRVIRVFKFAKPLMRLIQGLLDSIATVFYIMLFISVIIIVYSIMCTSTIGQNADLWEQVGEDPEAIKTMFGSMTNSSLTLFQFLTLDDWSNITRVIAKVWWPFYFIFIFYVLITVFVILSLLTGTMAEHMAAVRVDEGSDNMLQRRKEKDVFKAFKDLDVNNNDFLTIEEFVSLKTFPEMEEDLKVVLSGFEPADLFKCFDTDGDGQLTWFEFKNGMMELRKGVSKKQYFKLQAMMQRVVEQSQQHSDKKQVMSPVVTSAIDDVADKIEDCDDILNGFEEQMDLALQKMEELHRESET